MLPSLTTHTRAHTYTPQPNHFLHPYILLISFVSAHSEPENTNMGLSLLGLQGILSMYSNTAQTCHQHCSRWALHVYNPSIWEA